MEIQFHSFKREVDYPIAENISNNIPVLNDMAMKILTIYPKKVEINLWCRGSSGAIIAAIIAAQLLRQHYRIMICHVKKDGETNHYGDGIYFIPNGVNIIVDDFICSGDTINLISEQIQKREVNFDCLVVTQSIPLYSLIRLPSIIVGGALKISKDPMIDRITESQTVQYDTYEFPDIKF